MAELFKHPMWTNKLARSALFCLLALLPLSIIVEFFPSFRLVFNLVAILLCTAFYILMFIIARRNIMPDRDGKPLREGDTFVNQSTGNLYRVVFIEKSGIGYNPVGSRSVCVRFHAKDGRNFVVQPKKKK
jgi:hypothetical protein